MWHRAQGERVFKGHDIGYFPSVENPSGCFGDVHGNITTNGSVEVSGNVEGNIDTNGNVNCYGDINGDIDTNGNVSLRIK